MLLPMLPTVEDARKTILPFISALNKVPVDTSSALGRVLADAIQAPICLPHWDNASVDGYALRAEDVSQASINTPVSLSLQEEVPAGQTAQKPVEKGTCCRVFTGSPMPPGADAVVMQEDTKVTSDRSVLVMECVRPFEYVRFRGEDIQAGKQVIDKGKRLTPFDLGLMSALGITQCQVYEPPKVGVIVTGSECVEAGQPLPPGKIYESNGLLLQSLLVQAGANPCVFPIVLDELKDTKERMAAAIHECDLLITSGGVSVGEHDHIKPAIKALGGTIHLWRMRMKPGKPMVFAQLCGKPVFGLPGNPVSAAVTFVLMVYPALQKMSGCHSWDLPQCVGKLAHAIENQEDRHHFTRVRIDEEGLIRLAEGRQASHALGSLTLSDGLLAIPEQTRLEAQTEVRVIRWPRLGNF